MDEVRAARFYTRARRFPRMFGRWPGGGDIPLGPYSSTQVIGGAVALGALWVTRGVWGGRGWGDWIVLAVVPLGTLWLLRYAQVGTRSPWAAALGLVVAVTRPGPGRYRGRVVRLRRPHRARARLSIGWAAPAPAPGPAVAVLAEPPAEGGTPPASGPVPVQVPTQRPAGDPAPPPGTDATSGCWSTRGHPGTGQRHDVGEQVDTAATSSSQVRGPGATPSSTGVSVTCAPHGPRTAVDRLLAALAAVDAAPSPAAPSTRATGPSPVPSGAPIDPFTAGAS